MNPCFLVWDHIHTTLRTWKIQVELPGEAVTNHDELMSNFFAQPGGTLQEIEHWEFVKCVATSRWWFHFFNIHPYLGKISNLGKIFQMGWNHQLGRLSQSQENTDTLWSSKKKRSGYGSMVCVLHVDWHGPKTVRDFLGWFFMPKMQTYRLCCIVINCIFFVFCIFVQDYGNPWSMGTTLFAL